MVFNDCLGSVVWPAMLSRHLSFFLEQYVSAKLECFELHEVYVHVTVHRNKFLFNKTDKIHIFPKFCFVSEM